MTPSPSMRCLLPCVALLAFPLVGMTSASEPLFLPNQDPKALAPTEASPAENATLHFKPAGHVLGDVHPYFHEGECFLY
jgi:hypothetical protein